MFNLKEIRASIKEEQEKKRVNTEELEFYICNECDNFNLHKISIVGFKNAIKEAKKMALKSSSKILIYNKNEKLISGIQKNINSKACEIYVGCEAYNLKKHSLAV